MNFPYITMLFDSFVWEDYSTTFLLCLTLWHSERPKLHTILAFLSVVGLKVNWWSNHKVPESGHFGVITNGHFQEFCKNFTSALIYFTYI